MYLRDPRFDVRVTTDNRTQGVPEYHYVKSYDLFGLRNEWAQTLEFWNPEAAIVDKTYPLATYMALAKGRWKMVAQDNNFALFVPARVPAL